MARDRLAIWGYGATAIASLMLGVFIFAAGPSPGQGASLKIYASGLGAALLIGVAVCCAVLSAVEALAVQHGHRRHQMPTRAANDEN